MSLTIPGAAATASRIGDRPPARSGCGRFVGGRRAPRRLVWRGVGELDLALLKPRRRGAQARPRSRSSLRTMVSPLAAPSRRAFLRVGRRRRRRWTITSSRRPEVSEGVWSLRMDVARADKPNDKRGWRGCRARVFAGWRRMAASIYSARSRRSLSTSLISFSRASVAAFHDLVRAAARAKPRLVAFEVRQGGRDLGIAQSFGSRPATSRRVSRLETSPIPFGGRDFELRRLMSGCSILGLPQDARYRAGRPRQERAARAVDEESCRSSRLRRRRFGARVHANQRPGRNEPVESLLQGLTADWPRSCGRT